MWSYTGPWAAAGNNKLLSSAFILPASARECQATSSYPHPTVMDAKSLVKLAKSLSDPTRLRMLQEIARAQRLGCANLYEFVPISQPSMSQHVKALVDAGLVNSCKEGRNMYLTINTEKLQELEGFLQLLKMP
jgi:DNA-binding transcriptional ArsR family regulator